MSRWRAVLLVSSCLATGLAVPAPVRAQGQAGQLITLARSAMESFEFEAAAGHLRRALDPAAGASRSERLRALVLLCVAELNADRPDSAGSAAREALALDPEHSVDSLDFLHSDLVSTFSAARAALGAARAARASVLEIRGLPQAAQLAVDGVVWPTRRREVRPGFLRIEVTAAGYAALRDSVLVDTGATVIRDIALARADLARLSVTSEPWGVVYLDNERIGETPIFEREVTAGPYTLRVESPGRAESFLQRVDLEPGRLTRLGTVASAGPPAPSPPRSARADSLYRALALDSALALYRALFLDSGPGQSPEQRARAATRAGMIHQAAGRSRGDAARFDSARVYFRAAFRLAPAYDPGTEEAGPELRAAINAARAGVLALIVEMPSDTLLPPQGGRFRLRARPTHRARVLFTVASAAARSDVLRADSQTVSGAASFEWDLVSADGSPLPYGRYLLRVAALDSLEQSAPPVERYVVVEQERVEATPVPPPLPASAFAPESVRLKRGPAGTLLLGIALGAVTAAAPAALGNAALNSGLPADATVYAVAGTVSVAGIVGYLAGHRVRRMPENIERNRQLREEDAANRAAIAEANDRSRANARTRIRVEGARP